MIFTQKKGLATHLSKSKSCIDALKKQMICQTIDWKGLVSINMQPNLSSNTSLPADIVFEADQSDDDATDILVDVASDDSQESTVHSDEQSTVETVPDVDEELDTPTCYNKALYHQLKLAKILEDANAPHFLYQKIIEWAIAVETSTLTFSDVLKTRTGLINALERWMPNVEANAPEVVTTSLSTNGQPEEVDVVVFDFQNQLLSLLQDTSLFGNIDNLDVNPLDPFNQLETTTTVLDCVNAGQRFARAYKNMIQYPEKQFLLPIIFASDETKVSSQGKTSCWPLLFTTSILNQSQRNLPTAWRTLGYIYDVGIKTSNNEEKQFTTHLKYTRLHQILDVILKSYKACQQSTLLEHTLLRLGDEAKYVDLKVPCFFIIGDMQGGDKMASSAVSYSNKMNRLCRKCDIAGWESGNPHAECSNIIMEDVIYLVQNDEDQKLKDMNQYKVHNAWFDVDFGGCPYGIFSAACPVEPLHALENGLMTECIKVLYNRIGSSSKLARLDELGRKLTKLPRQRFASYGSDKNMPRLLWTSRLTHLSELTALEKVGIMFTLVVISLQDEGKKYFIEVLGEATLLNMCQCFQMMLSYWMWLKKPSYWNRDDVGSQAQAKLAIREMLSSIITLWPRVEGQGWNIAKFHEQLHVPEDITENGPPKGSHSGPVEHNHIHTVKRPSKRTQKRRNCLDRQLAQRMYESHVMNTAYNRMWALQKRGSESNRETETSVNKPCGSKGSLKVKFVNGEVDGCVYVKKSFKVLPEVAEYLIECYYEKEIPNSRLIHYCSEYKKDNTTYRAHPNYRSNGKWFDWVLIRWDDENAQPQSSTDLNACNVIKVGPRHKALYAPAQILCFVCPNEDTTHAIVKCCDYEFSKSSVFTTLWKQAYVYPPNSRKRPYLYHVDVDAIVRHSLIIPKDEHMTEYHEIWQPDHWANEFCE